MYVNIYSIIDYITYCRYSCSLHIGSRRIRIYIRIRRCDNCSAINIRINQADFQKKEEMKVERGLILYPLKLLLIREHFKSYYRKEVYSMKKKFDIVEIVKVAGWLVVAAGGIMTSWASDKLTQRQNDENFQKYIEENKGDQ